jgi:uncharacterized protein (DUF1778 family)
MRSSNGPATKIPEKASDRMNFRLKPHVKRAIQQAAALNGVDDSEFTISAAYASAIATIKAHERTTLEPIDHAVFLGALDRPPKATSKLREAFARRKTRITAK